MSVNGNQLQGVRRRKLERGPVLDRELSSQASSRCRSRSNHRASKSSSWTDSSYQHSLGPGRSHKRWRRVLVSEWSNSDSECAIEDRPRSSRNNISVHKEVPTFITQEVINLLKAIPSTSIHSKTKIIYQWFLTRYPNLNSKIMRNFYMKCLIVNL